MHGIAKPDGSNRVYQCSQSTADRGDARCDCPRVSATAVEEAVWGAVHEMLIEPGRLLRLVGLVAVDDTSDNEQDLRALDRKIRRLEGALGTNIAQLLAQGMDAVVVGRAVQELELDLSKLREHRERIVDWKASRQDRSHRVDRLRRLASSARVALAEPSEELRTATLAVLDVRARIVGTQECPTCAGRGLIPASLQPSSNSRRHTGDICPTCKRYRTIPLVAIEGLLPDIETLPETPDAAGQRGTPFTIDLTA